MIEFLTLWPIIEQIDSLKMDNITETFCKVVTYHLSLFSIIEYIIELDRMLRATWPFFGSFLPLVENGHPSHTVSGISFLYFFYWCCDGWPNFESLPKLKNCGVESFLRPFELRPEERKKLSFRKEPQRSPHTIINFSSTQNRHSLRAFSQFWEQGRIAGR